ncbi:hypothetical protein C8R45DRAFT_1091311 [Mycena sanguinolenta]|nr:hypothetical protein C8R45DRAFT_1091311 [Mycena sanguinolenta]
MANIAYIASYKPKNPKPVPKLLEDEEGWEKLIKDVESYIKDCKAKNKGKGVVKPFTITLVDTSGGDPKETAGKKSKISEAVGQPEGTPALKEHELFQKLEQKHFCQECKKPCVILDGGDHHILTHTELATWALFLSRHQATMNEPPAELKLEFTPTRQRKAKAAVVASANTGSSKPPMWVQHLMPVVGALFGGNRIANQAVMPAPAYPLPPPAPLAMPDHLPAGNKRGVDSQCPEVETWLAELDSDPIRGRIKLNYSQYGACLIKNGLYELSDVAKVSVDKLIELVGPALE